MVRDSVIPFRVWSTEVIRPTSPRGPPALREEASLNLLSFGCRFPLVAKLVEASERSPSRPPPVEQWVSMAASVKDGRNSEERSLPRAIARLERRTHFTASRDGPGVARRLAGSSIPVRPSP
jgi:hypothetical protein